MITYLIVDNHNLPIALYDRLADAFAFVKIATHCKVVAWVA